MSEYRVHHERLGSGVVTCIEENGLVDISIQNKIIKYRLIDLDHYFVVYDDELKAIIKKAKLEYQAKHPKANSNSGTTSTESIKTSTSIQSNSRTNYDSNLLLGSRAQTILIPSKMLLYEVIGYVANPNHVSSFEAEVPEDYRAKLFRQLFPGQVYRPIAVNDTPSGMPNKLGAQFRINFNSTRNCPQILMQNMGKGTGSCVGRINKSKFVLDLVQYYGFRFGPVQKVANIRAIASKQGFASFFDKGYGL